MRLTKLIAASCIAVGVTCMAQPAARLGLHQVLLAARDNPEVQLARHSLAAAVADISAADHAPVPVLSAKASQVDLQNGIGGGNLLKDKRIDKAVGVDWTWERGGKRDLRTLAAKRAAAAAQADIEEAQLQQQIAAATAYYDLLAAQEKIAQVEAIERSAKELAATAARRVRAGDLAQQDLLRTQIEAERAASDLRTARAERQRASSALEQLTLLVVSSMEIEALWPPGDAVATASMVVGDRPDVRAAAQRLEAAQAAFDGAQALRRSDVTLGASFDHFPGTSTRQLELRIQLPLNGVLGGYGFEGEIGRARALLAQAQQQLDKVTRAASADHLRLEQDLLNTSARIRGNEREVLPRARQVAAMAELAYSKGAMSLTDLIDARRTLRTVLLDDIAARADHARAYAAWQLRSAPGQP